MVSNEKAHIDKMKYVFLDSFISKIPTTSMVNSMLFLDK